MCPLRTVVRRPRTRGDRPPPGRVLRSAAQRRAPPLGVLRTGARRDVLWDRRRRPWRSRQAESQSPPKTLRAESNGNLPRLSVQRRRGVAPALRPEELDHPESPSALRSDCPVHSLDDGRRAIREPVRPRANTEPAPDQLNEPQSPHQVARTRARKGRRSVERARRVFGFDAVLFLDHALTESSLLRWPNPRGSADCRGTSSRPCKPQFSWH